MIRKDDKKKRLERSKKNCHLLEKSLLTFPNFPLFTKANTD